MQGGALVPSLILKCTHEGSTHELPSLIKLWRKQIQGSKIWLPPDWRVKLEAHSPKHRISILHAYKFQLFCHSYILMSGYLMLKILSPKSISMSCRPLDIIISINFRNPITHILQTPSLYQKRIKTRINSKNIRHLKISTFPL